MLRTPEVPRPQPARAETLPLNEVSRPTRPTPEGPSKSATSLARMKAAMSCATWAKPMSTLALSMRSKLTLLAGLEPKRAVPAVAVLDGNEVSHVGVAEGGRAHLIEAGGFQLGLYGRIIPKPEMDAA